MRMGPDIISIIIKASRHIETISAVGIAYLK
jgi:hypothetical protein